ncbi:MAG: vacuolar membrane-associated protein iml1 [Bogoriella megaspora]|nr:MAG: vacuolar membrane-associated protein iml1 [Bogoriella megaspora]
MAVTDDRDINHQRIYKICTLWVHEESFSKCDVVFNSSKFLECRIDPNSLARFVVVKPSPEVRDFQGTGDAATQQDNKSRSAQSIDHAFTAPYEELFFDENGVKIDGARQLQHAQYYIFPARDASSEIKAKSPNVQISISTQIANAFGFRRGLQVAVSGVDESSYLASHVEISFRDEYLARADMWRLTLSLLGDKTVYKGQKLLFLGTIKATVNNIYVRGEKVRCAFYSTNTKPVYRSESARYVIFIQMSKEMWDFDVDGSGDIMFNRVIDGFLPDLLKRWVRMQARHLVSIILFTRIEYEADVAARSDLPNFYVDDRSPKEGKKFQDFYRVVAMEMESGDWLNILTGLKAEFKTYLQEVSTVKATLSPEMDGSSPDEKDEKSLKTIIAGEPTPAMRGNILEAINMASSQFSKDYIDRDLVRTGISVIIVTPGTGVFQVEYDMLKLTTETLVGNGIGIDLVCLSKMPLHSVPLFKYKTPAILSAMTSNKPAQNPFDSDSTPRQLESNFGSLRERALRNSPSNRSILASSPRQGLSSSTLVQQTVAPGSWSYALPHWIDVSFWTGSTDTDPRNAKYSRWTGSQDENYRQQHGNNSFIPRCRIYELQTRDIMESEMSNISVPFLQEEVRAHRRDLRQSKHSLQELHNGAQYLHDQNSQQRHVHNLSNGGSIRRTKPRDGRPHREDSIANWMNDYDDNTFRVPNARQRSVSLSSRNGQGGEFRSKDPVSTGNMARPSEKSEHLKTGPTVQDHSVNQPDIRSRKDSLSNAISTPRPVGPLRQFSLGPRGFGVAQPSASTGLSTGEGSMGKVPTITRGFTAGPQADNYTPTSVSRRIQASLSREPSQSTIKSFEGPWSRRNVKPSQPISIRSPQDEADSTGDEKLSKTPNVESPASEKRANNNVGAFQAVSSTSRTKPRIALSTSAGDGNIPNTLSPISAMSPWLTLLNPSNPRKDNMSIASQFRRWHHVFPRPIRTSAIKWKSLCSPAAVPLTNEYFPSLHQLATEYHENPYKITQNEDDDMFETPKSRQALVQELMAFRLSHGFQLVIGADAAAAAGAPPPIYARIFDPEFMTIDGCSVFMSIGNTIHQLLLVAGGEVEIKRFQRKPTTAVVPSLDTKQGWQYKPLIKTMLSDVYEPRQLSLEKPEPELNWNYIDNFLAGYEEGFSDVLRFWRARFVLIPVELPARLPLPLVSEDSEEEIRLEGIRKLTQMWQRYRFVPLEERRYQAPLRTTKDTNPLAIEYQTRDPSAVVAAGVENSLLIESEHTGNESQLFQEQDLYYQSNIDLQKLAQDIQSDRGIPVMDRRWHLRLHYNCFVGMDLVSWLLKYFRDIETRDEAVEVGNSLMQRGLFQHVQQKHQFRDGNFFFQIASEYRRTRPDSRASWFGGRRTVPSTPSTDSSKSSPFSDYSRTKTPAEDSPSGSGNRTPTKATSSRPRVALSHVLRYDVDHRKRSYRPEIINLHYDRLHNPDNCYHIRIDWMNVTAKLIEDAIVAWATMAERYGLRLVELPIAEASRITETQPFRSPYIIKLAVPPPEAPPTQYFDATSFTPQGKHDKFAYHKAILKHLGFVLDMESKESFPPGINVTYSWGQPDYRYTQYIHKSGVALIQITENGNFLMLANRLCNNRAAASKETGKYDKTEGQDRRPVGPGVGIHHVERGSPFSSPLVRALSDHPSPAVAFSGSQKTSLKAEQLKDKVESFCHDVEALRAFYERAFKASPSPSPRITPNTDAAIPILGLPPSIVVREATASPLYVSSTVVDTMTDTE